MKILEENNQVINGSVLEYCAQKCHTRLWHQRQIRGEITGHREAVFIEAFVVQQINALPSRTEIIPGWNISINKVKGLSYFKDNTLPEEVRDELTAVWCEDILAKPEFNNEWTLKYKYIIKSYNEKTNKDEYKIETKSIVVTYDVHLAALADINRHQKKGADDNTFEFADVRRACTINDIKSRIAIKGKVHYMGNPFIPIDVKPTFDGIYKDSYWNASVEEVIDDYWAFKTL